MGLKAVVSNPGISGLTVYEKGTWTPTLLGSSTGGTQTYTAQVGRYIRIGDLVVIECRVAISAKGAGIAGNVRVAGLPFPVVAASANIGGSGPSFYNGFNLDSAGGFYQLGILPLQNRSDLELEQSGDNVTSKAIAVADMGTSALIAFTLCYRTA